MTDLFRVAAAAGFWACAAAVVYAWAGYPVLLWALSRAFGREDGALAGG